MSKERDEELYRDLTDTGRLLRGAKTMEGEEFSLESILAEFGQGAAEPAPMPAPPAGTVAASAQEPPDPKAPARKPVRETPPPAKVPVPERTAAPAAPKEAPVKAREQRPPVRAEETPAPPPPAPQEQRPPSKYIEEMMDTRDLRRIIGSEVDAAMEKPPGKKWRTWRERTTVELPHQRPGTGERQTPSPVPTGRTRAIPAEKTKEIPTAEKTREVPAAGSTREIPAPESGREAPAAGKKAPRQISPLKRVLRKLAAVTTAEPAAAPPAEAEPVATPAEPITEEAPAAPAADTVAVAEPVAAPAEPVIEEAPAAPAADTVVPAGPVAAPAEPITEEAPAAPAADTVVPAEPVAAPAAPTIEEASATPAADTVVPAEPVAAPAEPIIEEAPATPAADTVVAEEPVAAPAEPTIEEAPAAPAAELTPDSGAADADVPAESAPAAEVREKIFVIQPGKRRAAPVHRDEPEGYPGEPEGEKKIPLEQVMSETVEAVLEEDDGILESAEPLGKRVGAAFSGAVAGLQGHMAHRREARQSRPEPKRRTPEPLPPEPDMEDAFREEKRRCKKLHRAALSLAVPTALLILQAVLTSLGAIPAAWAADPLIGLGVPCALLAAAMILAAPVWKQALQSLREHQVGCELAAGVNALVVLADCVYGILTGESIHPPFTAASALLMWTCLYGLRKAADSRREAFYLANLGGRPPYAVAVTAAGACKQSGRLEGFYHLTSREDPARRWQMLLVPLLLALATVLAAVVCLGDHRMEDFLWVWSALLTASVPLSLPLTGTLPLAWLNQRLNRSGSAVAGYHGAYLVSRAKRIVVTDDDIFPPGTVGLNGLKVYGEEIGKVVSYAATLARDSGSQLSPLFEQLLTGEGGFHVDLQDLHFYEEGGVGGTVDGESVIMGSAYFMKKSHVDLPRDLKLKTGVFLAVDGRLIAVFAIKYQPSRNVEWALRAIRRNRIQPVLAVRGGNITPGLLRSKFNLDVKPVYPDVSTRLALSDLCAEPVERPGAIIYREGLMPFAETVIGGQRLVSVVRWATVLTYVGALAGLLLSYYLTHVGGFDSLSPLRMLAFLGLWLVPTVLLSGTVKHY